MNDVIHAVLHRNIAGAIVGEAKALHAHSVIHLKGGTHKVHAGPAEDAFLLQALWERKIDEFLSDPDKASEVDGWKRNA